MKIITRKSFKYRIYPTQSQRTNIENQFSMSRHLYNQALRERKEAYEKEERSISYHSQAVQLPGFKKERPWYKSVHSQVLQDALKRLDKAYQNFFRRVKSGETPGFPKFKKRGQWNSITYPQYREIPSTKIKVPKIGAVKLSLHRQVPKNTNIKTLTIIKEAGKWFACFSAEISFSAELKQGFPAIGIDMGLNDFLYDSEGFNVQTPKFFRASQKRLEKLQRRFAKTEKRSKKRLKLLKAIQKVHFKIKNQRRDFLHKASNDLLQKANVIVHEDLNIQGMSRRPKPKQDEDGKYLPNRASQKAGLNKSINDAGWYQFLTILKYKAGEQGKRIIGVNPKYTSQKCSACGQIVKKSLAVRTHKCSCGLELNRDHNAAINILALGMESLSLPN